MSVPAGSYVALHVATLTQEAPEGIDRKQLCATDRIDVFMAGEAVVSSGGVRVKDGFWE